MRWLSASRASLPSTAVHMRSRRGGKARVACRPFFEGAVRILRWSVHRARRLEWWGTTYGRRPFAVGGREAGSARRRTSLHFTRRAEVVLGARQGGGRFPSPAGPSSHAARPPTTRPDGPELRYWLQASARASTVKAWSGPPLGVNPAAARSESSRTSALSPGKDAGEAASCAVMSVETRAGPRAGRLPGGKRLRPQAGTLPRGQRGRGRLAGWCTVGSGCGVVRPERPCRGGRMPVAACAPPPFPRPCVLRGLSVLAVRTYVEQLIWFLFAPIGDRRTFRALSARADGKAHHIRDGYASPCEGAGGGHGPPIPHGEGHEHASPATRCASHAGGGPRGARRFC